MNPKPPRKFTPHTRMREIFGDKPDDFFSPARSDTADSTMQEALQKMEHKALEQMQAAIKDMQQLAGTLSPGTRPVQELETIAGHAFAIKCHAGMHA